MEPKRTDSVIFASRLDDLSLDNNPASGEVTPTCSAVGLSTPIISKKRDREETTPGSTTEGPAKRGKPMVGHDILYKKLRNISTRIIKEQSQVDYLMTCLQEKKIPEAYHVVIKPLQGIDSDTYMLHWKTVLADCSFKLMNTNVEALNQKIQKDELTKKDLLEQVSTLTTTEQEAAKAAINTVCGRVQKENSVKYKKRLDEKMKTPSRESFLESRHNKKARPKAPQKQKPQQAKHQQDRKQATHSRRPKQGSDKKTDLLAAILKVCLE